METDKLRFRYASTNQDTGLCDENQLIRAHANSLKNQSPFIISHFRLFIRTGALILASLLYVWQFPHFMALSWNLRHEYSRAGYMMTSVLDPALCKRVAVRHAFATTLVCLAGAGCSAISLGPWAGCALGLACLPPNVGLVYYAIKFARAPLGDGSSAAARRLFRATLIHLPVVMTAALTGTYLCAYAV